MMDQRAKEIFDEAFANVDRIADVEVRRDDMETWLDEKPDIESQPKAFNQWLARQPDQEPEQMPEPPPLPVQPPPLPARTFTDAEIRKMITDAADQGDAAVGDALDEMRQQLRTEIAALELRLDALTHETTKRQTIEAAAQGQHGGEVVDMLMPLERRRRA